MEYGGGGEIFNFESEVGIFSTSLMSSTFLDLTRGRLKNNMALLSQVRLLRPRLLLIAGVPIFNLDRYHD